MFLLIPIRKISRLVVLLLLLLLLLMFIDNPSNFVIKRITPNQREFWANSEDIFWEVHTTQKYIALTFDDGPDPQFTPEILDILSKNNVNGTFFAVGEQIQRYPEIAKRIVQSGNEIANHTYSHPSLRSVNKDTLLKELRKTHRIILITTDQEPKLFRPPGGFVDESIVRMAGDMGYKVVLWSLTQDTMDWTKPGVNKIVHKVLSNAKSGDIVILHDGGGNRSQTVEALQPIINGLRQKGFHLITASDLLEKDDVNN